KAYRNPPTRRWLAVCLVSLASPACTGPSTDSTPREAVAQSQAAALPLLVTAPADMDPEATVLLGTQHVRLADRVRVRGEGHTVVSSQDLEVGADAQLANALVQ